MNKKLKPVIKLVSLLLSSVLFLCPITIKAAGLDPENPDSSFWSITAKNYGEDHYGLTDVPYYNLPKDIYICDTMITRVYLSAAALQAVIVGNKLVWVDTYCQTYHINGETYNINIPTGENPLRWVNEDTINALIEGWEFVGWSATPTAPMSDTEIMSLLKAENNVSVTSTNDWYAVFKQTRTATFNCNNYTHSGADPSNISIDVYDNNGARTYNYNSNFQTTPNIVLPNNSYYVTNYSFTNWGSTYGNYNANSIFALSDGRENVTFTANFKADIVVTMFNSGGYAISGTWLVNYTNYTQFSGFRVDLGKDYNNVQYEYSYGPNYVGTSAKSSSGVLKDSTEMSYGAWTTYTSPVMNGVRYINANDNRYVYGSNSSRNTNLRIKINGQYLDWSKVLIIP